MCDGASMKSSAGLIFGAALALASPLHGQPAPATAPSTRGTIAVAAGPVDKPLSSMPQFVDVVSGALETKGFTIFNDPAHASYLAEVIVSQAVVGSGLGRDPHPDTIGMAGAGVAIPLSTGKSDVTTIRRTRLEIRIRRRDGGGAVWDGSAVTVRETSARNGADRAVASDLSSALLQI
jgi:hypothetical protein